MKILMLVNWKVKNCNKPPQNIQPPDYYCDGNDYWFFRYFDQKPEVDVVDISSFGWMEKFEKNVLHFYIWQSLRVITKLNKYDLVVSHGMQSGVVVSACRKFFKTKSKHILFDIGSFNSASEKGIVLKLMQAVSKSIDGVIYHTSSQEDYYNRFFPWITSKSKYIRFGTDSVFFNDEQLKESNDKDTYIVCVGYAKRDWDTVIHAYGKLNNDIKLKMIGYVDEKYNCIEGVERYPFIPIDELINQIYNAKAAVLPLKSYNYSYGQMTLLQQMSLGKCVIAANVPSLSDYIIDGHNAVLYKENDPENLCEKLRFVLNNDEVRLNIGKEAKRFVQQECNEKVMAQEIESFINTMEI